MSKNDVARAVAGNPLMWCAERGAGGGTSALITKIGVIYKITADSVLSVSERGVRWVERDVARFRSNIVIIYGSSADSVLTAGSHRPSDDLHRLKKFAALLLGGRFISSLVESGHLVAGLA